ncbi:MAG: amidohydrolase family protein [Bacteroidales bacterium]|nr:amidohydrolase family protein [Bacteroidales bacterium]
MERIDNVNICTGGQVVFGSVTTDGATIADIEVTGQAKQGAPCLLPGCVDAHVHFREPGLTLKADIASESRAALAGGVTTVLDMPNVKPTTTTPQALEQKHQLYREKCLVNYGLWYGITADNIDEAIELYGRPDSPKRDEICGFKVFLGSSTGGMLMNDQERLRHLFANTQRVIGIHSESEDIIAHHRQQFQALYGEDVPVELHPKIRDAEACMATTRMAVQLAIETGAQLHVCHLTTQMELDYISQLKTQLTLDNITMEVTPAHLWFSQEDYRTHGTLIKCNPAIKRIQDRDALRRALAHDLYSIGTDHAPHLLSDKQGGALRAASGMPSIQFSLLAALQLMDQGYMTLPRLVELMSTNPARRFGLTDRGEIAVGKRADLVLVDPSQSTHVTRDIILSKCGWSPFEGTTFNYSISQTWVNGRAN